jgi:hypothetical protein
MRSNVLAQAPGAGEPIENPLDSRNVRARKAKARALKVYRGAIGFLKLLVQGEEDIRSGKCTIRTRCLAESFENLTNQKSSVQKKEPS